MNEIPASVPFRLVLARTENLAVWMCNVRIHSTGMSFSIEAAQRGGDRLLGMHGFGKPEAGHAPPMLFGIEDSAGTISTNLPRARSGLRTGGGGGGQYGPGCRTSNCRRELDHPSARGAYRRMVRGRR